MPLKQQVIVVDTSTAPLVPMQPDFPPNVIERRRNTIVREIARYRTEFSQQAQRAIDAEVASAPSRAAHAGHAA